MSDTATPAIPPALARYFDGSGFLALPALLSVLEADDSAVWFVLFPSSTDFYPVQGDTPTAALAAAHADPDLLEYMTEWASRARPPMSGPLIGTTGSVIANAVSRDTFREFGLTAEQAGRLEARLEEISKVFVWNGASSDIQDAADWAGWVTFYTLTRDLTLQPHPRLEVPA